MVTNNVVNVDEFISLLNSQNSTKYTTADISNVSILDSAALKLIVTFLSKSEVFTKRVTYTKTMSAGDTVITSDDKGVDISLLSTDEVAILINGVEISSSNYTLYNSRVVLKNAIDADNTTVEIICKEQKILSELPISMHRVSSISSTNTLSDIETFKKDYLYVSSWNNIASITQSTDNLVNYFSDELDMSNVLMHQYFLSSLKIQTAFKYSVNNKTNIVYLTEKTITSDFPGYVLLAEIPYKFENKNEQDVILLNSLKSSAMMIEYSNGVDFIVDEDLTLKIFPPLGLSNKHSAAQLDIVSKVSSSISKTQNIIGPV